MRIEAELLWGQAVEEVKTAVVLFKGHRWAAAAFHAQQSVELALKAWHVESTGKPHPMIHKLGKLAKRFSPSRERSDDLEFLDPFYIATRYPQPAASKPPALLVTSDEARDALRRLQAVLAWIAGGLGAEPPKIKVG